MVRRPLTVSPIRHRKENRNNRDHSKACKDCSAEQSVLPVGIIAFPPHHPRLFYPKLGGTQNVPRRYNEG
jgi:hypothetical protein